MKKRIANPKGQPRKKFKRDVPLQFKVTRAERTEWDTYRDNSGKPGPDALMDAIRNPVAPKP